MREIKFRAWDRKENRITDFTSNFSIEDIESEGLIFYPVYLGKHRAMEKEDCILMQFTGLKDKNKKEIYEGDIILGKNKEIYTVRFLSGAFILEEDEGLEYFFEQDDADQLFSLDNLEVIGNIYENPKLLSHKQEINKEKK